MQDETTTAATVDKWFVYELSIITRKKCFLPLCKTTAIISSIVNTNNNIIVLIKNLNIDRGETNNNNNNNNYNVCSSVESKSAQSEAVTTVTALRHRDTETDWLATTVQYATDNTVKGSTSTLQILSDTCLCTGMGFFSFSFPHRYLSATFRLLP